MNNKRVNPIYISSDNQIGEYVLYWMQQSQRIEYNHALWYAAAIANERQLPLLVYFGITDQFPEANIRHYTFMIEGICEIAKHLNTIGIGFVLQKKSPDKGIVSLLAKSSELILDVGYSKIQIAWREEVICKAKEYDKSVTSVESDVVVPVSIVSDKAEYAARTIRPKINKEYMTFLDTCEEVPLRVVWNKSMQDVIFSQMENCIERYEVDEILCQLSLDQSVRPSLVYHGGEVCAKEFLYDFLEHKLEFYLESNSPAKDVCSHLSPYLHFGQISPVYIAKCILDLCNQRPDLTNAGEAFLEQLIVRRELAMNFMFYTREYDSFYGMTEPWAYKTMQEHVNDKRDYLYNLAALENGITHDVYWNAAMFEMVQSGYMHNYMRMYWAKKIYEWSKTPREAYETILYLNNKYFLDGRDANSYAGIAWCFGKHDRAWKSREIFGTIRYMNQNGLIRKFEMQSYLSRVKALNGYYNRDEKYFLF